MPDLHLPETADDPDRDHGYDSERVIIQALREDLGNKVDPEADITTCSLIPPDTPVRAVLMARQPLILAGLDMARRVFHHLSPTLIWQSCFKDGAQVKAEQKLAIIQGQARPVLTGERTALNLVQHLSGIATLTSQYKAALSKPSVCLRDTRKTTPGLRRLEKYAVRMGGGDNHRMGLHDAILIKDNHIAVGGGIETVLARAIRAGYTDQEIQIECDTLKDVQAALAAGARRLLLDNMSPEILHQAVELAKGRAELEASGGVTLQTIGAISATGVDAISIGRLTQSAPAVDMSLEISPS